jgi:hypothetical protein
MSTWIDDITDPKLKAAYQIVGNQDRQSLNHMIRALNGPLKWMNTPADNERLAAALYIKSKRPGSRTV